MEWKKEITRCQNLQSIEDKLNILYKGATKR